MVAKYDVFVSYSRHDKAFVEDLLSELGRKGIQGFLDSIDISAGARWDNHIQEAIRRSDAVVVVMSPSAARSNWVMAEVGAAEALRKHIIPVAVPEYRPGEQDLAFLTQYMWLDATHLPMAEVAARLVASIRRIGLDEARRALPGARRRRVARGLLIVALLILVLVFAVLFLSG